MKLVVTVMVRDEIDLIAAMIEHTLAQEPDVIIATDNGSVDGTTEVLQRYADLGLVELHHDPVHCKQQHAVVTQMARRARTRYAADWVINADADEFWVPVDKGLTLRTALENTPLSLNTFTVPVTNLTGRPARCGSGIGRLIWRDHRSDAKLQEVGISPRPSPKAVHRGECDVVVAEGNHEVSLSSNGQPDRKVALEILHLPWRSWSQFERKVARAGRGYEASPGLRPSKNHHGLQDYRRYLAGRLLPAYLLRQPSPSDLSHGEASGWFVRDEWLSRNLHDLRPQAHCPNLLAPLLDSGGDEPFDDADIESGVALGRQFRALEIERDAAAAQSAADRMLVDRLARERDEARAELRRQAGHHAPIQLEAKALAVRAARGLRRSVARR